MSDKHDINTYSKLTLGATFYLEESFHYINLSLSKEFASILFYEQLENIEPSDEDKEIIKKIDLPETPIGLLQSSISDILTEDTLNLIFSTWQKAQIRSRTEKHKFDLNHRIGSIEILGHLNNFGFFIETLINRHLLFLKQLKLIDDFSYSRVSIAKVMERIIYIFKDDLNNNKVHLNEIKNLFSLRNKTVHFTPDNAVALKPKISELIQIWNQSVKIIQKLEKIESFNEESFSEILNNYITKFKEQWN